jgi:hypothetical protein
MELSPVQWGLIGVVVIVIALLLAHRYFLPFSLLPKEDPLDEHYDPSVDTPIKEPNVPPSVSSEDARPANPHDKVRIVAQSPDTAQYECDHSGPSWCYISVYGDTPTKIISRKWCPDCFVKLVQEYTTRCACCGLPIRPEDGVTFYHASNPRIAHRDTYQVDDFYIGCMRDGCREPTKFLIGHWAGHDFRPVFSMDQDVDWTTQIHKAVGNA